MAAKKEIEEMRIRPAKNGGHTIIHEHARQAGHRGGMHGGMYAERPPSEEHTFGPDDDEKVLSHVASALGLKNISTKTSINADDEAGNQK